MQETFREELARAISPEDAQRIGVNIDGYRFDPKKDFVFKAILSTNSEESRLARLDFLSAVLGVEVISAEVIQNELAVNAPFEKQSTFDLHLRLQNGDEVNVEIQVDNNDDIAGRAEYYVCKLFGTQEAKGKTYAELHKVIEIMIVDFTLFPEQDNFLDDYQYRNKEGRLLTGKTKIIFLELTKLAALLTKPVEELTAAEMWAIFLKYGNDEKRRDLIHRIEEKRGGIGMAGTVLDTISSNRTMQLAYIDRLKYETDQEARRIAAERKGKIEGANEKAVEVARNMLKRGVKPEYVAEDTGLSFETVLELVDAKKQ